MLAGGTLEGRLVDDAGQAVGGARIDLTAVRGTLDRTTVTADDGTFAFAAVPAEVLLSIARPDAIDRVVLRKRIEVEEGKKKVVEITLPKARDAVRVTVVDDRDQPIDVAQVTLLSLDPEAPLRRTLFTGPEGAVNVRDAAGMPIRVEIDAPGWARAVYVYQEAPDEIRVEMKRGVVVEGRVTAVRGRTYVSGANVTLLADGARKMKLTDADGWFRFRDVSPGEVTILVDHAQYAASEVALTVVSTGRADRPFEVPAIDLAERGAIEGEVVDLDGKPVVGARVALGVAPAYLPVGTFAARRGRHRFARALQVAIGAGR